MPKLSARETVFLGTLAIGSIAMWLTLSGGSSELQRTASEPGASAMNLGDPPVIHKGLLALEAARFDPQGRDLFKYDEPERSARPGRPTHSSPTPSHVARRAIPIRQTTPPLPARPTTPEPAFDYIGFLGPKDDRIAVFDSGTEVIVARVGEVVDDSFELLEFRYEAVILEPVDQKPTNETVRLEMQPR